MVTPQEAKAMRDALRAAMVTAKEALDKCGISVQQDMLNAWDAPSREWFGGRLSIYIQNATDAAHSIVWSLNYLEENATKEVQA
jgi:hypothetical protein